MTLALALVFGAYVCVLSGLAVAVARQRMPDPLPADDLPEVVVIVAARNEEADLGRCLAALQAQDYPAGQLSIVVANDHSTDGTAAVVEAAARVADGPAVRMVCVSDPVGAARGKALALHTAIEATTAPVMLFTDADCAPPPSWARALASRLVSPDVGVACGMTRLAPRPDRFFDRVQAIDWEALLGLMSGAAALGAPATGMGNNMGVRRDAYHATGGYPAIPFSLTEDFALVQAVLETGRRVEMWSDPRSVVWSLPVEGPGAMYRQRLRWARGGLSGDPWVVVAYAGAFALHALLLAGLVTAPAAGAAALGAKVAADAGYVAAVRRTLGGRFELGPLLVAIGFMSTYMLTLPFLLLRGAEVEWKGRYH